METRAEDFGRYLADAHSKKTKDLSSYFQKSVKLYIESVFGRSPELIL